MSRTLALAVFMMLSIVAIRPSYAVVDKTFRHCHHASPVAVNFTW